MSIHLSPVLRKATDCVYIHYCPGCKSIHQFWVNPPTGPSWTYDGNHEKPTVSPSIRHQWGQGKTCHYFIRVGNIEFCSDCTHDLAGQVVPMPTFPDNHALPFDNDSDDAS